MASAQPTSWGPIIGPNIKVSGAHNEIATDTAINVLQGDDGKGRYRPIVGTRGCDQGKVEWRIKLLKSCRITVGICTDKVNAECRDSNKLALFQNPDAWVFTVEPSMVTDASKWHANKKTPTGLPGMNVGSVVGILLDCDAGAVTFSVDGKTTDDSTFADLPVGVKFFPCAAFGGSNEADGSIELSMVDDPSALGGVERVSSPRVTEDSDSVTEKVIRKIVEEYTTKKDDEAMEQKVEHRQEVKDMVVGTIQRVVKTVEHVAHDSEHVAHDLYTEVVSMKERPAPVEKTVVTEVIRADDIGIELIREPEVASPRVASASLVSPVVSPRQREPPRQVEVVASPRQLEVASPRKMEVASPRQSMVLVPPASPRMAVVPTPPEIIDHEHDHEKAQKRDRRKKEKVREVVADDIEVADDAPADVTDALPGAIPGARKRPPPKFNAAGKVILEVENDRYPYCIVWTPCIPITWMLPLVGHLGVGDSQGQVYEFMSGGVRRGLSGGPVCRYVQLPGYYCLYCDWDEGLRRACATFNGRTNFRIFQNSHSFVADALNHMGYGSIWVWNQFFLMFLIFFGGRYTTVGRGMQCIFPFLLFCAIVVGIILIACTNADPPAVHR